MVLDRKVAGVTGMVSGRARPWARSTALVFSTAPWVRIGPIDGVEDG